MENIILNHFYDYCSMTTANIIETPEQITTISDIQLDCVIIGSKEEIHFSDPTFIYFNHSFTFGTGIKSENIKTYFERRPLGKALISKILSRPEAQKAFIEFEDDYNKELNNLKRKKLISNMKYYRLKKHIKQSELANILGSQQHHVSRWERQPNLLNIKGGRIKQIAVALDVSVEDLLND